MIPQISVIILNFNRPHDTIECVQSVLKSAVDGFALDVVVVDNSETDDSTILFQSAFPSLSLIRNFKNLGYAEGNNVGIRFALQNDADYVFVLNNDCVVECDTIQKLLSYARSVPRTGILAPLVCRYDNRFKIDSCGTSMDWFRLRPRLSLYQDRIDQIIPAVIEAQIIPGSALFLSKQFLNDVGEFDKNFFLIHEDADLCLRAIRAGYQNLVLTSAIVFHKISSTFGVYPNFSIYYSIRNFLYLSKAHNSFSKRCIVASGLALLCVKRLFLLSWTAKDRIKLSVFFLGVRDYFCHKRGICGHPI